MQKNRGQGLLCLCFSQVRPTRYLQDLALSQLLYLRRISNLSISKSDSPNIPSLLRGKSHSNPISFWRADSPPYWVSPYDAAPTWLPPPPRMTSYSVMPAHLYLLSPRRLCLLTSRRGARYGLLSRSLWVSPTKIPFLWECPIVRAIRGNFANIYKFYEIRYRHISH